MSSNQLAISIQNISKYFEMYEKPSHRLWQMIFRGHRQYYKPFWALRDVSFEVKKGECVGIIGRNGAGKSTLLQIVTGTLTPSSGSVDIKGRVAALLELGSGFNPEFTGKENVYLNGSILGLTEEEIDTKFDDICAFADIGDFIDQPVKSYSSGMMLRLAFGVIAHVDADVLIVDEALAVGDIFFTQKCMRFLRKFMETNTVLFVSHEAAAINSLCNRAVLLEKGTVKLFGTAKEVTEAYLEDMYASVQGNSTLSQDENNIKKESCIEKPHYSEKDFYDMRKNFINTTSLRNDIEVFQFSEECKSFGKGGAKIESVILSDMEGKPLSWIVGGEKVRLRSTCIAYQDLYSPILGFMLKDKFGEFLFGDNTWLTYSEKPLSIASGKRFIVDFVFVMPILQTGDYTITIGLAEGTQHEHIQHHWCHDALALKSLSTSLCTGKIGIPMLDMYISTSLR